VEISIVIYQLAIEHFIDQTIVYFISMFKGLLATLKSFIDRSVGHLSTKTLYLLLFSR
jgi:hypothetical protein